MPLKNNRQCTSAKDENSASIGRTQLRQDDEASRLSRDTPRLHIAHLASKHLGVDKSGTKKINVPHLR